MNYEQTICRATERAVEYEKTFHGCAQCVVGGIIDAFEVDAPIAFRVSTGFSGGMGCTGRTCGALTGGILSVGLFVGRDRDNMRDPQRLRWQNFALVKELIERYERTFGSLECREVQERIVGTGIDFWDPEQAERFAHEYDGHVKCAERVVGQVAQWTAELIAGYLTERPEEHA